MTGNVCFDQEDMNINIFDNDLANWLDSFEEGIHIIQFYISESYNDFNGVNFNLDSTFSIATKFTGVLLETDDNYDHTTQNIPISRDKNDTDQEYSSTKLTLPTTRIFSNDIRHNFARMFMNTFNSGDFIHVQNFLKSYMTQSCKVVAQHFVRDRSLKFPPLVVTYGARQFSHHLMGHHIQYPDLIMSMTDCRVITHPNWLGTKVEIDMGTCCTKMCSLSVDDWVPPLDKITRKYEDASKANQIVLKPTSTSMPTADITNTTMNQPTGTKCIDIDDTVYLSDLTIDSEDEQLHSSSAKKRTQQQQESTEVAATAKKKRTGFNRAKHARIITQGGTAAAKESAVEKPTIRLSKDLTPPGILPPHTIPELLNTIESKGPYIPDDYCQHLFNTAKPVATPVKLVSRGKMTFYLNEFNQLQHMHCEAGQTNYK